MGVPKFYRWISERYPCLSTVAREYQLPEFDNLYLDMNGIIHVCSHPNDSDAHFRISEEEIFMNIMDYIDFIFRMVKPKKCFFMAVDGVAPRAKMNQQRERRFRTAKEAEEKEAEARKKGEELPKERRFDSNCISPGTEFMERLHEQLKYFVVRKLSSDPVWQKENLKVYLSGHNAPGEGEHKAMDFIRYIRSQDDYDPNTRHCIYGQDADLIMLALCTHEPHIALLREEVIFGKKSQKRIMTADKVTFHLLHINLLREYLDHEFSELKRPGVLKHPYDLERIIDDWLLICFLVGNDFLPHLPNLHIAHDALPILYRTYCDVMPSLDGYLHERGKLNLKNFEVFMRKLGERDMELFEDQKFDDKYVRSKMGNLKLNEAREKFPELDIPESDSDDDDSGDTLQEEFRQHKRHYYMTKMEYQQVTEKELREQAEGYIRAIQWNLHYYYDGVQSWSWYYPYHYSPYISDIKDFGDFEVNFEMGKPFLPFQQLLSIMPAASKDLIPGAYWPLMVNPHSPLREYFPTKFDTDLNGKTQQWEAVVLIKYIEEELLLESMSAYDHMLSDVEKARNTHGPHMLFEYSKKPQGPYLSPTPNNKWSPSIAQSFAKCTELPNNIFHIQKHTIVKGRLENSKESLHFPGFPSLKYLPHEALLRQQGCTVFQHPSRGYNMIVDVSHPNVELKKYASLVGKVVHIDYPHLRLALVTRVSDGKLVVSATGEKKVNELEAKEFPRQLKQLEDSLRNRWGIETGENSPKLLINCKPLIGRKYVYKGNDQVTTEREWSNTEVSVLHSVVVAGLQEHEPEVAEFRTVEEVFPENTRVFLLSPNEYGQQGVVRSHKGNGFLLVETRFRDEPDFTEIQKREPELRRKNYLPTYRLARELGIESNLVARLTGCIQVQLNSVEAECSQTINIGMNLKFNARNEEVVGYSKKITTKEGKVEWRFSQETLAVLRKMITQFKDFYLAVKPFIDMDKIPLQKCFPGESFKDGLAKARELAKWIKDQPFSKAPRQKTGGVIFDEGVVEAIQNQVEKHLATPEGELTVRVHVNDIYLPGLNLGLFAPDQATHFSLYHRVVNVREDITVPFGLKGTIIGIHRAPEGMDEREMTYEVLFDKEFSTGLETHGAKGHRVATLSVVSMINITCGHIMLEEKARIAEMVRYGHGAWSTGNTARSVSWSHPTQVDVRQRKSGSPQTEVKMQVLQRKSRQGGRHSDRTSQPSGPPAKNGAIDTTVRSSSSSSSTGRTPAKGPRSKQACTEIAEPSGRREETKKKRETARAGTKNKESTGAGNKGRNKPTDAAALTQGEPQRDDLISRLFGSIPGVKATMGKNPNPVSVVRSSLATDSKPTTASSSGDVGNGYDQGLSITVEQLFATARAADAQQKVVTQPEHPQQQQQQQEQQRHQQPQQHHKHQPDRHHSHAGHLHRHPSPSHPSNQHHLNKQQQQPLWNMQNKPRPGCGPGFLPPQAALAAAGYCPRVAAFAQQPRSTMTWPWPGQHAMPQCFSHPSANGFLPYGMHVPQNGGSDQRQQMPAHGHLHHQHRHLQQDPHQQQQQHKHHHHHHHSNNKNHNLRQEPPQRHHEFQHEHPQHRDAVSPNGYSGEKATSSHQRREPRQKQPINAASHSHEGNSASLVSSDQQGRGGQQQQKRKKKTVDAVRGLDTGANVSTANPFIPSQVMLAEGCRSRTAKAPEADEVKDTCKSANATPQPKNKNQKDGSTDMDLLTPKARDAIDGGGPTDEKHSSSPLSGNASSGQTGNVSKASAPGTKSLASGTVSGGSTEGVPGAQAVCKTQTSRAARGRRMGANFGNVD